MGVQDPNLKEEPGQASLRSLNHAPGSLVLGHSGDSLQQLDSGDDSLVFVNYALCLQAGYSSSGACLGAP